MEGDQYLASFNFPAMERKPKVAGLAVLLGEVSELELQKICFNRSLRNEINQLEEQNDISFVRVERKGVYGGLYLSYRVASAKDCEKLAKYYNLKASQRGYKPLSLADINEAMNRFNYVDPLAVVDGERVVQKPSRTKANI